MSFFRSERMVFCHIILHQEYAFDCVVELGYEGKVHFLHIYDADHVINNKFSGEIQRCNDLERVMRRLQDEINRVGMHTVFYDDADEQKPKERDLLEIEKLLYEIDTELTEVVRHCDALQNRRFNLLERREVLMKVESFLTGNIDYAESQMANLTNLKADLSINGVEDGTLRNDSTAPLIMVAGSIPINRFEAFEIMVWRVARGNAITKHEEFKIPDNIAARVGERVVKYAFLILFVGEQLQQKILKICQGFQAKIFPCPNTPAERMTEIIEIGVELLNLNEIFEKSCEHKKRVLAVASADLFNWRAIIRKTNAAYFVLNRFGIVRESKRKYFKYLQVDCWIPKQEIRSVRAALTRGSRVAAGNTDAMTFPPILVERHHYPIELKQPTYFRTNKFTNGFQNLIDAYGMATYRELNPAPYTIITFPFLFAVMFGDVGHGIIMACFAAILIWREKKIKQNQDEAIKLNEIFDILFAGRYIILLMGLFSVYTGFIYNDLLSKPTNMFGSSWRINATKDQVIHEKFTQLDPADETQFIGSPYIFGLDPIWNSLSENAIILNNSLKMKMAIILGVLQMMFGLILSAWNALFFREKIDFYLVFLPQIIFISCLFFYLVILIFHKWLFFGGQKTGEFSSGCAPSILITFINMVLMKSPETPPQGCSAFMYPGQNIIQHVLLFIALACIPVLLCGKPLHFMYQNRRIKNISDPDHQEDLRRSTLSSLRRSLKYNVEFAESGSRVRHTGTEEKLSEIWIHQGIHTIECVLGSVSHTASYLRLWALSLAHSQLSHVLWKMVLSVGLTSKRGYYNSIIIYLTFAAFATLSVAILVVMEGLSAFLHTLRLHWVEFQSKFYGGLGEPFVPFRFQESKKRDSYINI